MGPSHTESAHVREKARGMESAGSVEGTERGGWTRRSMYIKLWSFARTNPRRPSAAAVVATETLGRVVSTKKKNKKTKQKYRNARKTKHSPPLTRTYTYDAHEPNLLQDVPGTNDLRVRHHVNGSPFFFLCFPTSRHPSTTLSLTAKSFFPTVKDKYIISRRRHVSRTYVKPQTEIFVFVSSP